MRTGCAAAALMLLVAGAAAQMPPPAAPPPSPPPAPQIPQTPQAQPDGTALPEPAPGQKSGFIDSLGHFIEDSVSTWNSGLKGAAGAAKDAADAAGAATRDTADAVSRWPGSRVIAERAICPTAPNGAPDCRTAAETICKAHGFASGGSVDVQTAEKCPPIALNRPGGEPPRCVLESYVTRALCQ